MLLKHAAARFQYPDGDSHIPGAPGEYADPLTEALLLEIQPLVEQVTGIQTYPTFSYCRIYKKGNELSAHSDRIECEIGVTMVIGGSSENAWTFNLETPDGWVTLPAKVGDIVIYKACEMTHQRGPLQDDHQAQAFLFYIDKYGPLSSLKYDRRAHLGIRKG